MEVEHVCATTFKTGEKMKNYADELIRYTQERIRSLLFLYEHRTTPAYFTRKSPLNFENITLLILNLIKKAIKVELMNFFYHHGDVRKTPSRQAFTQGREKVSYLAFKDFFDKSCELAEKGEGGKLYKGYRLFASDGTSFVVGQLKRLWEYFGERTSVAGKAMCRIGAIVDVLNGCIVRATVSPFCVGERALAIEQVEQLKMVPNALFLFDRGYWSPELVGSIIKNGQKFLMRLASNTGKTIVKDENGNAYELRRYSFILPHGEVETLLTNLPLQEVSDDELACLYTKRWGIETKYLELKDRLQIDELSGGSVNIVLQDIYATLYISNLAAFICFEADEIIEQEGSGKKGKYGRKAKRTLCISALRTRFVDLCLLDDSILRSEALQRFYEDLSSDVTYVRKSKSRPRVKKRFLSSRNFPVKPVL